MTADITIAGLGTVNIDHVTRQVEAALASSAQVLFLDEGIATRAFLEARCERVVDLSTHWVSGRSRIGAHHAMAAHVIDAALTERPVTFAVSGHPTHLVPATFLVRDLGALLGLRVEVLAGVSALDQICAECLIDPASQGLQSFEATDVLLRRRPIASDVPLLLWQVGRVESHLHSASRSVPSRFERLTAYLLRFYPQTHRVVAVEASSHPLLEPVHLQLPLASLPAHAARLTPRTTLYVPPVGTRPVADVQLYADLTDPLHLAAITE
jgi:uncharacterized protein YabN with tetrapyrrole methylase and pyrophosphatase domain